MKKGQSGQILTDLISQSGKEIKEISTATGIDKSLLYKFVSNERRLNADNASKLADYFTPILGKPITIDRLLGRTANDSTNTEGKEDFTVIPVIGTVRAGRPIIAEENVISYEMIDKKSISGGEHFYLMVNGDSMIDEGIFPRGRVLVRRQDWVDNNQIAVVLVNGDEATIKRVKWVGQQVILYAANPKYEPQIYGLQDIKIIGRVVKSEKSH